jgi:hypothetical protein
MTRKYRQYYYYLYSQKNVIMKTVPVKPALCWNNFKVNSITFMSLNNFIIKIYSITNLIIFILYMNVSNFLYNFNKTIILFDFSKNENYIFSWTDRVWISGLCRGAPPLFAESGRKRVKFGTAQKGTPRAQLAGPLVDKLVGGDRDRRKRSRRRPSESAGGNVLCIQTHAPQRGGWTLLTGQQHSTVRSTSTSTPEGGSCS